MSRMNWTILALLLMIPGAAGLGWGIVHQRQLDQRIAEAAEAIAEAPSADEYLALYSRWSALSATEKAENPWGQGLYGGPEIQRRLRQDQQDRLMADLPDLDAGLKSHPPQLAEVLYGADWQRRLADYQRQRERRSVIASGSGILLFAGCLLFAGGILKGLVLRYLDNAQSWEQPEEAEAQDAVCSTAQDSAAASNDQDESDPAEAHEADAPAAPETRRGGQGYFQSTQNTDKQPASRQPAVPSSDRPASPAAEPDGFAAAVSLMDSPAAPASQEHSYFGWAIDPKAEEEHPAVTNLMTTQATASELAELTELTEEVSAIRQYAAAQQDQMRKFQDGYDWMIVRRFCMRFIRCIDNLDDRLEHLGSDEQMLREALEDIRDELVFALESSGVEQYGPDLKAPFKGLEKYVEAVRQRVPVSDAALAGTIAEIVRPGYQYLVNDDEVKIVRCAQVKLYDAAETEQ